MMMSETDTAAPNSKLKKLLVQLASGLLAGALVGYGVGYMMGRFGAAQGIAELPVSVMVAGLTAAIYLLLAVMILIGTASPGFGAKFLNVEDAEELREQHRMLVLSGAAMALWGAALLALALAMPNGPLPQGAALAIGAGGLITGTGLSVMVYKASDELMLAVNLEAAALTYGLVLLVLGGWGMLAHLGYWAGPEPLDLLTACYILVLVASFIAIGRRGMLEVR
jgi:hypothetical protein